MWRCLFALACIIFAPAIAEAQISANVNANVINTPTVKFATGSVVQPGNTANTTPWLATINASGNSAAVAAASTAVTAANPALAVGLSPNSPTPAAFPASSANAGYASNNVANVTTTGSASYTTGFCVGTYTAISVVGNNAQSGLLTRLRISSAAGIIWPFEVYVFQTTPGGTYTDHTACSLSTTNSDQDKMIAAPTAVTLAALPGSTASWGEITFTPPATFVTGAGVKTIYVLLVTTGTTVAASGTTDVHLSASVVQQ